MPSLPTPAALPGRRVAPFVHHGRGGAMVRLALVNLLLNLATLSMWRFWGRTRVRRALWGATTAWGDPVEYAGTGRELLVGFLMVVVAVLLPLVLAAAAVKALAIGGDPRAVGLEAGLQGLVFLLIAAGVYRARRYQLSRTLWRGIRGGLGGSVWAYALRVAGVALASAATLGWAWPWGEMALARYRMRHTGFGDQRFDCDASAGRPLYVRFALVWLCGLALLAAVLWLGGWAAEAAGESLAGVATAAVLFSLGVLALAVVLLAWPWAAYRAAFYRRLAAGTRFGAAAFSAEVRTWPLVRLVAGNWLIVGLSLGTLRPWAAQRTLAFACSVITVAGEPDFALVGQAPPSAPRTGEGILSVFDGAGEF